MEKADLVFESHKNIKEDVMIAFSMATMNNPDVPEDAVINILTRLPVKSIMRFRNPDFISRQHLIQTRRRSSDFIIKHGGSGDDCFSFISSSVGDGVPEETLTVKESVHIPFTKDCSHNPLLLGPVNGVLCLCDHCEKIALWNPAIAEFKPLPLSQIERPAGTESTSFGCLGFGFDRKSDDYKIVRFVTNYFDEGMSSIGQVELYSLKNDSWRQIQSVSVFVGGIPYFNQYHDGVYYWWADGDDGESILSFDFTDEVFDKIALPDFDVSWVDYFPQLTIFDGILAVVVYSREGHEKMVHIWVMTERGVKASWAKQVNIGPIPGVERPLGFYNNTGLFLEDLEGRLVLYDLASRRLKNLKFAGEEDSLQVVNYVESLVSIHGRREDEDEPFVPMRY